MGLFGTKLFDTSEKDKISEIAEILKGIISRIEFIRKFKVFELLIGQQDIPNDQPGPIGCRWLLTLKDCPFDTC